MLTFPYTAVDLDPEADSPRVNAVWDEANPAGDNRWIHLPQLSNVGVGVTLEDLSIKPTNH